MSGYNFYLYFVDKKILGLINNLPKASSYQLVDQNLPQEARLQISMLLLDLNEMLKWEHLQGFFLDGVIINDFLKKRGVEDWLDQLHDPGSRNLGI